MFARARIALPEEFAAILEGVVQTGTILFADIERHFPAESSNGNRERFQGLLRRFKIKVVRQPVASFPLGTMSEREKNECLARYRPLVKYVVDQIATGLPKSVDREDLVNSALIGLFDALEKYDETRGTKFETYAIWRIKGAVLDELRSMDWASRTTRRKARQVEQASQALEQKLGRAVSDQEMAEAMKLSLAQFMAIMEEIRGTVLLSLDQSVQVDDEHDLDGLTDMIADARVEDPQAGIEEEESRRILIELINGLTEQERLVVALYYYEEMTLKEIAAVMFISESRVSQIHTKAILRLKGRLGVARGKGTGVVRPKNHRSRDDGSSSPPKSPEVATLLAQAMEHLQRDLSAEP